MNSIRNYAQSAYKALPTLRLSTPQEMIDKVKKVAIPAFIVLAASHQPDADAFTSCVLCAICLLSANPACVIPCATCLIMLPVPGHFDGNE